MTLRFSLKFDCTVVIFSLLQMANLAFVQGQLTNVSKGGLSVFLVC